MSESRRAMGRSETETGAVAAQVGKVLTERVGATVVLRPPTPIDVQRVSALFQSTAGVRQAMIATVIFGQPRALEPVFPGSPG